MDAILSVHITHKQADIEKLELIGSQNVDFLLNALSKLEGVTECVVLKTCNRVEMYTATRDWEGTRRSLESMVNGFIPFDSDKNLVQFQSGTESIGHLLRVASGLESMIIGEDQIQSQVKEAFEYAETTGHAGPVLSLVFRKAINVGKKVRTETKVNKGCVSIGSAAVELAEEKIGSLAGKTVLVIGAGEMATLIAKHLIGKSPEAVFVSNRTYARAVELAWVLNGKAVRFDSLTEFLAQSDVVLCATSATHMILEPRHLIKALEARRGRKMMIIDVSFPRNVSLDVRQLEGVELYDIDGLREVSEANILKRREEMKKAERIILGELKLLDRKLDEMEGSRIVKDIFSKYSKIKENEVRKAIARVKKGQDPIEKVMDDFGTALMGKFLADPTESLKGASRDGDGHFFDAAKLLFNVMEASNDVPAEQDEKDKK
ncbi:MAG: glutamyl-tRNA reductase [Methanomassiliicoccales archaeon]